ncbi:MAG: PfkB family carbohydrate kinase [Marinoscillum sp.]
MDKTKVLAFGEVLWDFIEGDKHFGGAPINFAAHMVQCGREAAIVTAVGEDKLGDQAIEALTHLKVGQDFVQRNDKLTGRVMVFLEEGQPTYRIRKDVAYDYIERSVIDSSRLLAYGAFYFGTLAQRHVVSRSALDYIMTHGRFSTVFYDVNLRRDTYTAEAVETSFGYCTIAKMNDEEVQILSALLFGSEMDAAGFTQRILQDYPNIEVLIITGGGEGCTIRTRSEHYQVSAQMMPVKDSVGAGDAFCAAFLNTYLSTKDPRKSARIGNLVGGFVVSESGAIPIYPEQFRRKIEILSEG